MNELTQKRVRELLKYNHISGDIIWLNDSCRTKSGGIAGSINKKTGYMQVGIDSKLYQAHRIIWLYVEGYLPENDVDHINGIKHDNRWKNLRHISHQCNSKNRCKHNSNNKSGVAGVCWHKISNSWHSYISVNKKQKCLGYYKDFDVAVNVRYEAELDSGYFDCKTTSTAYLYLNKYGLL